MVSAPVLELELDADVLERLQDYVAQLALGFGRITRRYWAGVYLHGLMLNGERKSIQPLAQRVNVPGWHGDTMQALQQFITESGWDEQAVLRGYRQLLAASIADPSGTSLTNRCRHGRSRGQDARILPKHRGGDPGRFKSIHEVAWPVPFASANAMA